MGYRDNFYIDTNIIGYTGVLHAQSTVYFRTATENGHITQVHGNVKNIGRGPVRSNAGYTAQNENVPGKGMRYVERWTALSLKHVSRNLFTQYIVLATDVSATAAMLRQSIANQQNLKPKDT